MINVMILATKYYSHSQNFYRELNGWLYSTGEEAGIPELYILQFSDDGKVIDVMHKSLHYKNGHTVLQYQFLQGVIPELKMTGPGPGE